MVGRNALASLFAVALLAVKENFRTQRLGEFAQALQNTERRMRFLASGMQA